MALFKILNNFNSGRSISQLSTHTEGYCYFDKNTGKFWIDTSDQAADMLQLGGTFFGTCTTDGDVAAKVVSNCPGFVLYNGASVYVRFSNTNTANPSNLTLNINGTGACNIKAYGITNLPDAGVLSAGLICNFVYDGTYWCYVGQITTNTDTVSSAYCTTMSGTANKVAACDSYRLLNNSYIHVLMGVSNTAPSVLYLNINNTGAYPIFINGETSSSTNYTLPAGTYLVYFDGSHYQFRTDGLLYGTTTGNIVNITNEGSTVYYTYGDGTTASFVVPHTQYTAGSSISIANNVVANMGVRSVSTGETNGTISVNTGGNTRNVAVKGLGSAAYENSGAFAPAAHAHGNVSELGWVTNTVQTIADGDYLLVADSDNNDKLVKTSVAFDGTTTNEFLSKAGTWQTVQTGGQVMAVYANSAGYAANANTANYAVYAASAAYADTAAHAVLAGTAGFATNARNASYATSANFATDARNAESAAKASKDSNNNVIVDTYATKTELNQLLASNDAMIFKGTLGTGGTITSVPTNSYLSGYTYKIITAGTYAGQVCEVGDLLIAVNDGPSTGSTVITGDWTIAQTNIDGAVVGPPSSTSGALAIYSGTTGKGITGVVSIGSNSLPIYIDNNGRPQTITSYQGQANSAKTAITANNAVTASYSILSGTATYAINAGEAVHASSAAYAADAAVAITAGTAETAGTAAWALNARQASCAGYAMSASYSHTASWAIQSSFATVAGHAQSAGVATTAEYAVIAESALSAGSATWATTAGNAIDNSKVAKAGDTMSDNLTIKKAGGTGLVVNNTAANHQVEFCVSATKGGIFDRTNSIWLVSSNTAGDVELTGHASCATYAANALTATNAIDAANAVNAEYAGTASHAITALSASSAACAGYAVTAEYALSSGSATWATTAGRAIDTTKVAKAGDIMYGNLHIETDSEQWPAAITVTNINGEHSIGIYSDLQSNIGLYDRTNSKWIVRSTTAGDIALFGQASCAAYAASALTASQAVHASSAAYATSANAAVYASSASYAKQAVTASDAIHASTAEYALNAAQANFANNAGIAATAIWAITAAYAITAGQALHAASATWATTAGNATDATKVAKTGDTMSGNLTIQKAGDVGIYVWNTAANHNVMLNVGGSGKGGLWDSTNSKWIVYSTTAGDVDLTGHASCATYADYATTAIRAIHAASAAYAAKALQDSDGNKLQDTYLKQAEFDAALMATNAMRFAGTIGTGGTVPDLPNNHLQGDTYKVVTNGTYGQNLVCEIGDTIIALRDGSVANDNDWVVVQSNIDGAVIGPVSAVDGQVALFNGVSGKLIKAATINPGSVIETVTFTPNATTTLGEPIPADNITSWAPNKIPTATVNGGVLIFYAGTTAALAWDNKNIPNVTSVGTTATFTYTTASYVKTIA